MAVRVKGTERIGPGPWDRESGLQLKLKRLRAGLSQYEVAAELGIHPGRLSEIEAGRRQPAPELLERLLKFLGAGVHDKR